MKCIADLFKDSAKCNFPFAIKRAVGSERSQHVKDGDLFQVIGRWVAKDWNGVDEWVAFNTKTRERVIISDSVNWDWYVSF